jgi:hypothetical protein
MYELRKLSNAYKVTISTIKQKFQLYEKNTKFDKK